MFYSGMVSANPPKHDRWPPWTDIRFVLVRSPGKLRPRRGLVLDWKREHHQTKALVVFYDDAGLRPTVKLEWVAKSDLLPVPVDPNWTP